MPMDLQSTCGLLQCFLTPLLGAGLDPSREVRRDMPLPRTMDKSRQDFFTDYLDGSKLLRQRFWANWESRGSSAKKLQSKMKLMFSELECREPWAAFPSREELLVSSLLCRRGLPG